MNSLFSSERKYVAVMHSEFKMTEEEVVVAYLKKNSSISAARLRKITLNTSVLIVTW
jgi:hypothetical protein